MQFKEKLSKYTYPLTLSALVFFGIILYIATCAQADIGGAVLMAFLSFVILSIFLLLFFKNSSISMVLLAAFLAKIALCISLPFSRYFTNLLGLQPFINLNLLPIYLTIYITIFEAPVIWLILSYTAKKKEENIGFIKVFGCTLLANTICMLLFVIGIKFGVCELLAKLLKS